MLNDFGHITCYYFVDKNHNGRRDGKEQVMGDMMHTTPRNEAETLRGESVTLEFSHGCIHVRPRDIDEMIGRGFLRHGNMIVVHDFTITMTDLKPEPTSPPYEVHFFPGGNNVVVMGWAPE